MESILPLLFIFSLIAGQGFARPYSLRSSSKANMKKLFVFGDSYVDTGNVIYDDKFMSKYPNGITYPGEPAGRYSDGYVLTDYIASYLGLKSPIPYVQLHHHVEKANSGVNFAYGGTGVFDTLVPLPSLNRQIDFFEGLLDNYTLTPQFIDSSIALVSVSGNDYLTYLINNLPNLAGFILGMRPFIRSVVNNIEADLRRISSLGVKNVMITALGPVECVPFMTFLTSYEQCFPVLSVVADYHNNLLRRAVARLNRETNNSRFIILDLHHAFSSVIQNKGYPEGNITFSTPLKPCCSGICGQIDAEGNNMYELCKDPKSAFYWDYVHPSHLGWFAALSYLTNTLKQSI